VNMCYKQAVYYTPYSTESISSDKQAVY